MTQVTVDVPFVTPTSHMTRDSLLRYYVEMKSQQNENYSLYTDDILNPVVFS